MKTPEEIAWEITWDMPGLNSQFYARRIAKAITDERAEASDGKTARHLQAGWKEACEARDTLRARVQALEEVVNARALLAANEEPKPVEERAEELAGEINRLFDSAIENSCTCGSAPEGHCPFCSAWEKAEKKTTALILAALTDKPTEPKPGVEERARALTDKLYDLLKERTSHTYWHNHGLPLILAALTEDGRASKQPASDVEEKANTLADVITQTAKAVGKPDPEGWNPDGWQSFLEWLRAELTEAMTEDRRQRELAESRARDMKHTFEFGADVMNKLVLPRVKRDAGIIANGNALELLERWLAERDTLQQRYEKQEDALTRNNHTLEFLLKERDALRRQVEQLENALRLILPMAKGYAYSHRLGSNLNYIDLAESALSHDAEPVTTHPQDCMCHNCLPGSVDAHPATGADSFDLTCDACHTATDADHLRDGLCVSCWKRRYTALEQKLGVSRAEDWLVLKERIAELERERDKWREMLCVAEQERDKCRAVIKSDCEDDTRIRELVRPLLGEFLTDGDSMGVPTPTDIVESLIARINGLVKGLEQERNEAGRELKERIARIATLEEERDHQTHLAYEFSKALRQAEEALGPLAEKAKWWNNYYPQERGSSPLAVPLRDCRAALAALDAIRKALGGEKEDKC